MKSTMKPPPKMMAGKQAAPFAKGGGRDPAHANTAKGKPKKK